MLLTLSLQVRATLQTNIATVLNLLGPDTYYSVARDIVRIERDLANVGNNISIVSAR